MAAQKLQQAVGRRKSAIASVSLSEAKENELLVNGQSPKTYFKTPERAQRALAAFADVETASNYKVTAHVVGGGVSAQADAVRHAVARAISAHEPAARTPLKKLGYLSRDARVKERKKPGLVKARKRKQWSKR